MDNITSNILDAQNLMDQEKQNAKLLAEKVGQILTEQPKNNDFTIQTVHDHLSGKGIYAISKTVKRWSEVKDIAEKFTNWLNINNGRFDGLYKTAFAISHCQVCEEPYRMFVVNKDLVRNKLYYKPDSKHQNNKNFYFPSQIILNAEILECPKKVQAKVPKREVVKVDGKVTSKITTKEGEVNNMISVPDACMSFPDRKQKNMDIYYKIKVRYQIKGWFGFLRTKTEWVEGLKAHIFQHEIDHANALNIYYKNKNAKAK